MRLPLLVCFCGLAASGCGAILAGDCTDELGVNLSPSEKTVSVGQSFTPSLELTTCGGRKRWHPTVVWLTPDTTVVCVDSIGGRITGRAPGSAHVTAVEHASNGDFAYGPLLVQLH
jgi:uncharacterized protein YjdB